MAELIVMVQEPLSSVSQVHNLIRRNKEKKYSAWIIQRSSARSTSSVWECQYEKLNLLWVIQIRLMTIFMKILCFEFINGFSCFACPAMLEGQYISLGALMAGSVHRVSRHSRRLPDVLVIENRVHVQRVGQSATGGWRGESSIRRDSNRISALLRYPCVLTARCWLAVLCGPTGWLVSHVYLYDSLFHGKVMAVTKTTNTDEFIRKSHYEMIPEPILEGRRSTLTSHLHRAVRLPKSSSVIPKWALHHQNFQLYGGICIFQ